MSIKNAIIIGASSGIGEALALDLGADGYSLGLASRRKELLEALAAKLPQASCIRTLDLADGENAEVALKSLIAEMKDVDLFVISSGVGFDNPEFCWTKEADTIAVNVVGFTRVVNVIGNYLEQRGSGHIVGISSIAAIRGHGSAPAYGASKAFMSNYLDSLRHRFETKGLDIVVTDIKPGFVDTAMAKGPGLFWVAPVKTASKQILNAIKKRKRRAYVTKRWALVAWLLRILPDALYNKIA